MTLKKWSTNEIITVAQINGMNTELIGESGRDHIRQLIDRTGIYSAGAIDGWGEAYIDSNGRNNSVSSATAKFDTNKYICFSNEYITDYTTINDTSLSSGTSVTVADINNAFDNDNTTYALASNASASGSQSVIWLVGKSFTSSRLVKRVYVKATLDNSDSDSGRLYPLLLKIQTYDGSNWSDSSVLINQPAYRGTQSYDGYVDINIDCSAIRLYAQAHEWSFPGGGQALIYLYEFQIYDETEIPTINHTIPTGTFNSTINTAIGTPIIADWEEGVSVEYKLTNATEDTGWLSSDALSSFIAFTSEPTNLSVRLIQKTSNPTGGYPSIKGFWVRAT